MKFRLLTASLLTSAAMITAIPAMAAGDAAAGKAKSAVCAACHGADGNSMITEYPKLAGQHETYLAKQLREFKSGKRNNAIMLGMVAALSEQDMDDLAAFYAEQTPNEASYDAAVLEAGQNIYRGGITETGVAACMGCHSPSGSGNGPAGFPKLSAQHPQYTVSQLKTFKSADRNNDTGKMMRNVAKRMSEAEMQAVAAYLAAMK